MTAFIWLLAFANLLAIAAAGRHGVIKSRREQAYWDWHNRTCAVNRQNFDNSASTIQTSAAKPSAITAATIQNMVAS
jgi:hypothetical protein